jgi:hypothetical protein
MAISQPPMMVRPTPKRRAAGAERRAPGMAPMPPTAMITPSVSGLISSSRVA